MISLSLNDILKEVKGYNNNKYMLIGFIIALILFIITMKIIWKFVWQFEMDNAIHQNRENAYLSRIDK